MSVRVRNKIYYRTQDACKLAGISRSTFFRWIENDVIEDASHKDRRGWRLFTDDDIKRMKNEASKII